MATGGNRWGFVTRRMAGVALVLLLAAIQGVRARAAASPRPNIVVILADDLGYGDLSCYGATKVRTPHCDRLAREGMRFTDAHSPASVCTPTRYNLLTGRYAWRTWEPHSCVWSDDPLLIEDGRLTVAGLLKSAGYRTACIGKWHLGFGRPGMPGWDDRLGPDYNGELRPGPLEVGFDYFFGIPHVGQFPHVFIENHRVVGLRPDDPLRLIPDPRTAGRRSYRDRLNLTPAHTFTGGQDAFYQHEELALRLTGKAVAWIEAQTKEPFFLYFALRNVHAPLKPNPRFRGHSEIGVYGEFLQEMDWCVGEVLGALDRRGLASNTLVVFSSDNGAVQMGHRPADIVDYQGHKANGPLRGQKTEAYEGGQRVPLLVRWPGRVRAGAASAALVALTDVLATVAELLERPLPADAGEDSFSFLPALLGRPPSGPVRDTLVMSSNQGLWAIRQGNWKLILGQGGGGLGWKTARNDPNQPPGQLYHLGDDLGERTNVYDRYPQKVTELKALLQRIQTTRASRRGPVGSGVIPVVARPGGPARG
jgi:arylsulfatase A